MTLNHSDIADYGHVHRRADLYAVCSFGHSYITGHLYHFLWTTAHHLGSSTAIVTQWHRIGFRITGSFLWNPLVTRGSTLQRASNAEFWGFIVVYSLNKLLNKQLPVIWKDLILIWRQCNALRILPSSSVIQSTSLTELWDYTAVPWEITLRS